MYLVNLGASPLSEPLTTTHGAFLGNGRGVLSRISAYYRAHCQLCALVEDAQGEEHVSVLVSKPAFKMLPTTFSKSFTYARRSTGTYWRGKCQYWLPSRCPWHCHRESLSKRLQLFRHLKCADIEVHRLRLSKCTLIFSSVLDNFL